MILSANLKILRAETYHSSSKSEESTSIESQKGFSATGTSMHAPKGALLLLLLLPLLLLARTPSFSSCRLQRARLSSRRISERGGLGWGLLLRLRGGDPEGGDDLGNNEFENADSGLDEEFDYQDDAPSPWPDQVKHPRSMSQSSFQEVLPGNLSQISRNVSKCLDLSLP